MGWFALFLAFLLTMGTSAGLWVLAFVADEFEDRRDKGALMAALVTAIMILAFAYSVHVWRIRRSGVLRHALAMIVDRHETQTPVPGTLHRYRRCQLSLIFETGELEVHGVEPHLFDRAAPGRIGVAYFHGPKMVDFRGPASHDPTHVIGS